MSTGVSGHNDAATAAVFSGAEQDYTVETLTEDEYREWLEHTFRPMFETYDMSGGIPCREMLAKQLWLQAMYIHLFNSIKGALLLRVSWCTTRFYGEARCRTGRALPF